MTISIVRAAQLCDAIYAPVSPGVFDRVLTVSGVVVGIATIDGCATFSIAGSECGHDWIEDFDAEPVLKGSLGYVHAGFYDGMQDVYQALQPYFTPDISIQGHSLGAARAAILAGMCAINAVPVNQLVLLAPPRPGYGTIRDLVASHVVKIYAYHNRGDIVSGLPVTLPGIEPWCDVAPLIQIQEFIDIDPHGIANYVAGAQKPYGTAV